MFNSGTEFRLLYSQGNEMEMDKLPFLYFFFYSRLPYDERETRMPAYWRYMHAVLLRAPRHIANDTKSLIYTVGNENRIIK